MTMNTLVFDIETVPDIAGGRRLYGLSGLDDAAAAEALATGRLPSGVPGNRLCR